jgi:hypothetical protein
MRKVYIYDDEGGIDNSTGLESVFIGLENRCKSLLSK